MTDSKKVKSEYSVAAILAKTILWLAVGIGRGPRREGNELAALQHEVERLRSENAILRKRLKGRKSPRHTWKEKLHILWHMEVFGVSRRQVENVFGITKSTYYRWLSQAASGTLAGKKRDRSRAFPGTRRFSPDYEALVGSFDDEKPLIPQSFPNTKWNAGKGSPEAISICAVDCAEGANGTPCSLKWSYSTNGTWVDLGLLLSGSWQRSVDLSGFDSVSFYIKTAQSRNCSWKIQTAPWKGEVLTGVEIPLELGPLWTRVEIPLKNDPRLSEIDLTRTYTLSLVDWDPGHARSVVWLDEVFLHQGADAERSEESDSGASPLRRFRCE